MNTCPECGSERLYIGWRSITTDILPWRDEFTDAVHQHAHGWLHVNWICKDCKHQWDTNEEHVLRCWCGWVGKLSTEEGE